MLCAFFDMKHDSVPFGLRELNTRRRDAYTISYMSSDICGLFKCGKCYDDGL